MKSSSIILIVLVAVGVAVADVSELANRYLPPSVVENAIAQDFSVTEAPVEVTTTSAGTTVVEIEQVPLEEMHYNEQPQQEPVQAPELPSLPSVYEQPPALIYEAPVFEAQTDAPVAPVAPVSPVVAVDQVAAVVPAEEAAPIVEEASSAKAQEAPVSEEIIVVEEAAEILDAVLSDPLNIKDLGSDVDVALVPAPKEAPIVKESATEVPLVGAEPEPAHVLSSDGYRYKTANRFRYRF